ncbi:TonB-dependent siderophore receptor, partial [Acinetobacter baumannii]
MLRISISSPQIKGSFPLSLLSLMILNIQGANAEELIGSSSKAVASMPTIKIEAMSELDPIKSYIDYDKANVTRNGLDKKDIPQTVDTIDV